MNVLVFAPHADDEILGAGGSIARHIAAHDAVSVCIATRPAQPVFSQELYEVIRKETIDAHAFLQITKTFFLDLPAVMLEDVPRHELNAKVQNVVEEVRPELVYMPHFGDMQKDHLLLAEAIMVAVRPKYEHRVKKVLAYETLSETEWNLPHSANAFLPNVYHDISGFLETKKAALGRYRSQVAPFPNPRSLQAVEALARYRGSAIFADAAESFMLVREIE